MYSKEFYISDCAYVELTVDEDTGRVECACINGAEKHSFMRDVVWAVNRVENNLDEALEILRKEDITFAEIVR